MQVMEIWRRVSLYLDHPFRIYLVNQELYRHRHYGWLVPQYLKKQLTDQTEELRNLKLLYSPLDADELAQIYLIQDLQHIMDMIIGETATIIKHRIKYQKNQYGTCQTLIKRLIKGSETLEIEECRDWLMKTAKPKETPCLTHMTYRLSPISMCYLRRAWSLETDPFLAFKALIY